MKIGIFINIFTIFCATLRSSSGIVATLSKWQNSKAPILVTRANLSVTSSSRRRYTASLEEYLNEITSFFGEAINGMEKQVHELSISAVEANDKVEKLEEIVLHLTASSKQQGEQIEKLHKSVQVKVEKIEALEQLTKIFAPKSCAELESYGITNPGYYYLDKDGPKTGQSPSKSYCGATKTEGVILVATGYPKGQSVKTEIFDLDATVGNDSCQLRDDFPIETYGGTGALVGNQPLICGGTRHDQCYVIGQESQIPKLSKNRHFAASIALNSTHLLITGGYGEEDSSSSEIISVDGGQPVQGPNLPMDVHGHCFFKLNQSTAIQIGGAERKLYDGFYSKKVWLLDLKSWQWNQGPSLKTGRVYHSCTMIHDNLGKSYVVVAGGLSKDGYLKSVEILDLESLTWMEGPDLPQTLNKSQMLPTSDGLGAIVIGGFNEKSGFQSAFLQMQCQSDDVSTCNGWSVLPQKLSVPREAFVAMYVPREQLKCNN